MPQSGRMPGARGQALDTATTARGSGSNMKPHTNSGDSDRPDRARVVGGDYGKDATVTEPNGSALRGKPTKDQRTFNESRSNNTRTLGGAAAADNAVAQGAGMGSTPRSNLPTGNGPTDAASRPLSPEAAPASASSIFK